MKKLIYPIIFLLSVQIALAMYGGESEVIHSFSECSNLTINVSASLEIVEGEFSFLNCTKINQSYWECDCSDNFDLTLTTEPNTVNSYSFDIVYYYQKEEASTSSSGGGGSSGSRGRTVLKKIITKGVTPCIENWECTDWSECSAENIQTRKCTDLNNCGTLFYKPTETKSCTYTSKEGEEVTTSNSPTGLLGITGGVITGLLGITSGTIMSVFKKTSSTAIAILLLAIIIILAIYRRKILEKIKSLFKK